MTNEYWVISGEVCRDESLKVVIYKTDSGWNRRKGICREEARGGGLLVRT